MRRALMGWMSCGALLAFQANAEAQYFGRPFRDGAPCGSCGQAYVQPVQQYIPQAAPCGCAQQAYIPIQPVCQTQLRPIVQTHLQPQQFVTYRDVASTQYRQEQFTTQVPVTTMQQVTRDEGAYQMVWVPRMVTHQVPTTTYQTQVGYRAVPYQVTQRVAQVETRMVPQQTVQYIPQTTMATTVGCNTCPSAAIYQQALLPGVGYGVALPAQTAAAPAAMTPPGAPPVESTTSQQSVVPEPPAETSMHGDWQTVEPRHAATPTDQTTSMIPSDIYLPVQPVSWTVAR